MPGLGTTLRRMPAVRLILFGEILLLTREHLLKLDPHERRRVLELVRRGRGRPRNLSDRERRELARLLEKTEPRVFLDTAVKRVAGLRNRAHETA